MVHAQLMVSNALLLFAIIALPFVVSLFFFFFRVFYFYLFTIFWFKIKDVNVTCSGTSPECPVNSSEVIISILNTICRPANGSCDIFNNYFIFFNNILIVYIFGRKLQRFYAVSRGYLYGNHFFLNFSIPSSPFLINCSVVNQFVMVRSVTAIFRVRVKVTLIISINLVFFFWNKCKLKLIFFRALWKSILQ